MNSGQDSGLEVLSLKSGRQKNRKAQSKKKLERIGESAHTVIKCIAGTMVSAGKCGHKTEISRRRAIAQEMHRM